MLGPKILILIALSLQARDVSAHKYCHPSLPKPVHLSHVPGCYSALTGKVHPFDVSVRPKGVCKKLVCGRNGYTKVHACDEKEVPEGCYLSEVTDQPYPQCCPEVICDDPYYKDDYVDPYYDDAYFDDPYYDDAYYDDQYYVDPYYVDPYYVDPYYVDPYYNQERDPYYNYRPGAVKYYDSYDYQPRVRHSAKYYERKKRGDDYKLDDVTTNNYDVKDVSSRRSPWNKNKSV